VSSICWYQIGFIVIIDFITAVHVFKGPNNSFVCSLEVIFLNVIGMQAVFLLDIIAVTKYIFVNRIKNAVAVDESFFQYFINISTFSFSLISQSIYMWMPGRNPNLYYMCIGSFPMAKSHVQDTVKVNLPFVTLLVLSGITHIYIGIKKMKTNQAFVPKAEIVSESRCQFHEHFMGKFFVQKSFRQLFLRTCN